MNSRIRLVFFTIWLVSIFAGGLSAQNITGTLTGVVVDPTGANVAGAKVVSTNTNTGVAYTTSTTEAGVYVLPALPPELTI